jgi:archaemetzincin
MSSCEHLTLCFEPSSRAAEVGFRRAGLRGRGNENTISKQTRASGPGSFPAPLVLPGDDLALDPDYPPQTASKWLSEEDRNEVTPGKNVIYVAAPPAVQNSAAFILTGSYPEQVNEKIASPNIRDISEYLKAFYHGLPVRLLASTKLAFTAWNPESAKSNTRSLTQRFIGLDTSVECIRIRTRASTDEVFKRQLNLDDLLDAAISILPDDAYALLLLIEHDLYENADDVFTCGRAYGGSRVAVISTARYNPNLDYRHGVDREHAWPASHCKAYIEATCAPEASPAIRPKKRLKLQKSNSGKPKPRLASLDPHQSALQAAVSTYSAVLSANQTPSLAALAALWLGRVCRTASHELGHCLGIDHCVYYACVMQGSASLAEDARQPLYLCPIDRAKLLQATGADMDERYAALLAFCGKHGECAMFAAFAAWIQAQK